MMVVWKKRVKKCETVLSASDEREDEKLSDSKWLEVKFEGNGEAMNGLSVYLEMLVPPQKPDLAIYIS